MKKHKIPKEFLGAFKAGHRVSAREFIDEELSYELLAKVIESKYTDKTSLEALEYITKFNNEFHKNVIKKGDENALHNTDELRKDLYNRENARNRDITSREHDFLQSIEPMMTENEGGNMKMDAFLNKSRDLTNYEDIIINFLDVSNEKDKD